MRIYKKTVQRPLFCSFCFIFTLVVSGCSLFGGSTRPRYGKDPASQQIFTEPLIMVSGSSDLTTLDPALAYDQNSLSAISLIYTGLVQLNDQQEIQTEMASSWSQSSDRLTCSFTLRTDLKFTDFTPITSNDVAYSLNRALLPATKSTTAPI